MEEVHVFEGEVQRTPKTETVGAKAESLKAGDARHYDRNAKFSGKPTPCDPKKFVRKFASAPARGDLPPGLLAYDGFDYRSANALFSGKANGGFGWVGSWKAGFTRPADNETFRFSLNVREGLARRDSSKSAVGGSFDYAGFAAASRRLAKPVRMDTGGTTYISFLVRRSGPPSDPINSAGILFWTHDDFTAQKFENARQRLFVGIKKDNRLSARLQKMDAFAPISVNNQETLLIVAKIASKRTGADQVFLRAYAANDVVDAAEPATWTVSSGPFQCDLTFDWLQVYINSKTRQTLDEIRLGTTWPSVTAAYLNRQRI
jgi:hypothetical protein